MIRWEAEGYEVAFTTRVGGVSEGPYASLNLGRRPYHSWWDRENNFGNIYHVAYIVRAVTPGTFALPATNVSDMYAPRVYGRTAMGSVTVAPR